MEVVRRSGRGDHGEKMLAVVPFAHLAFPPSGVDAVLHTARAAGRQRLAGHEGLTGSGRRVGCKTNYINTNDNDNNNNNNNDFDVA